MVAKTKSRLLVVDNDDSFLATLERELKEAGYGMVTTWSGIEPLRL